jgi:hypothetical protein
MTPITGSRISGQLYAVPAFLKKRDENARIEKLAARASALASYASGRLSIDEADALGVRFADRGLGLITSEDGIVWQREGDQIVRMDENLDWIDEVFAKKAQRGVSPLPSMTAPSGTSEKSSEEAVVEEAPKGRPKQYKKEKGKASSGNGEPTGHVPPWAVEEVSSSSGAGRSVSYEHRTDVESPFAESYYGPTSFPGSRHGQKRTAQEVPPAAMPAPIAPAAPLSTVKPHASVLFFYDEEDSIIKIEVNAEQRPSGEIIVRLREATGKNIKMFGSESAVICISYGKSRFVRREAEDILNVLAEYYDVETKSKRVAQLAVEPEDVEVPEDTRPSAIAYLVRSSKGDVVKLEVVAQERPPLELVRQIKAMTTKNVDLNTRVSSVMTISFARGKFSPDELASILQALGEEYSLQVQDKPA